MHAGKQFDRSPKLKKELAQTMIMRMKDAYKLFIERQETDAGLSPHRDEAFLRYRKKTGHYWTSLATGWNRRKRIAAALSCWL